MTTRMSILGWEAEGLRCPDHSVDFVQEGEGKVQPISLLQMPNGTGKTTTLGLLRTALSGGAEKREWDYEEVASYRKRGTNEAEGRFSVDVGVNDKRVTFSLLFDFDEGSIESATTLSSGMKKGFHPPPEIGRFVRSNLVKFFVFDGELAEDLIDPRSARAQAAIDDLFQLGLFQTVQARIDEYWKRKTEDRGATTEKGYARRRNRVERLEARISELEDEKDEIKSNVEKVEKELEERTDNFEGSIEEREEERRKLEQYKGKLSQAEAKVQEISNEILSLLKNPSSLSSVIVERLYSFKRSLDQAKLPESAAREFFEELADQEECVCGRGLDEETRTSIRRRADNYLGSENIALLNAIKSRVKDQYEPDPSRHEKKMKDTVKRLKKARSAVAKWRTKRDAKESEIASGHPNLEDELDQIKNLRGRKEELKQELNEFEERSSTSGRDEDIKSLPTLRKRLTEKRQKLAEITNTLELRSKREVAEEILQGAHQGARESLSVEIRDETNERIEQLMPDKDLSVAEVGDCLRLEGKRSGSTGENLSVGYAFLSTLFNRAGHRLPFIVDSPANPIDLDVRRRIGALVPGLAEQFIAFTISSERSGFLTSLEEASSDIKYITLFRKNNPKVEWSGSQEDSTRITKDGVLVHGRDFFCDFQVDEEA